MSVIIFLLTYEGRVGVLDRLRALCRASQLSVAELGAGPVFPLSSLLTLIPSDKVPVETRTWASTLIGHSSKATRCSFFLVVGGSSPCSGLELPKQGQGLSVPGDH